MASRNQTDLEPQAAQLAVQRLLGFIDGMRACAVLDAKRAILASSHAEIDWAPLIEPLLDGLGDREGQIRAVNCGTGSGEVFVVSGWGLIGVAVTERFTLSSLVISDLRALLGDLARHGTVERTGARTSESSYVAGAHKNAGTL